VTFRQVAGPAGGCLADLGDRLGVSRAAIGSAAGGGSLVRCATGTAATYRSRTEAAWAARAASAQQSNAAMTSEQRDKDNPLEAAR